ncbi:YtxH domain-containing protein [Flavobacterium sp. CBA20B-1]|uniref:YtxH domain-containing protein n=1 Tax=unclassified Flavobacterium TaxID=196869 RepID=UPI002224850A|nr:MULTISPECIES: YtxH domain-containing protein [unclassified Flavobacterium]WCM42759.1 YtxH domain-containing protein [Flavobacterium sp. CBA20B-1]
MKHFIKIGSILAGAATGATVGLLLALAKGEKIRHKLLNNFKKGVEAIDTSTDNLKNILLEKVSEEPNNFEQKLQKITNRFAHQKDKVIATLEDKISELSQNETPANANNNTNEKEDVVYKAAYETKTGF